jgi:hypothetical protein
MRGRISATFAVALLVLSATAALAQTVFSDFPVNGQISAFSISGGGSTSDSFTLASPATVGQVVFGAWVNPGDTLTSLTWAIGTTPYDTSLGTGVAAATSAYDFTNVDGFDVDTITFSIPSVSLPAGTYYLTLTNAVSASSQPDAYWDINDATGVDAWNNISGHVSAPGACYATVGISGSCAESFQLLGPTTGTTATLTSPLSFPNTPSGTTSAALAATLSNTGTTALNNIVPSITGANPSDFALSTGANACGATLAAGSSCSIYVTFTPATATSFSATLSVADSATGSPQTATLTGTGTAPVATLSSPVAFPNTPSGTTSAALAATLSNTGNGALNNIVPSITGANPGDFALSTGANACGATLAAGSSCSIYVTFTPASATSFSATLSVADSATGSPQTSTLTGTGTAPAASLTPSLAFPSTTAGTTSSALAATLSNTGNGALNNIVPSITGANPSDFAISTGANACGATLAAGSSCSIYVTFTPATATSFSATLSVADSATGSPQTATLTGTGTAGGPTTWPNGYNYQATFTVAAGKVPSAQTNFPALISGTYADFATTANGGRVANTCTQTVGNNVTSVPCDLIFTSDAAGTQLLSWEYETYAATTGAVNVWVNVPNLANGSVVYAWYGQPSVTTPQSTPSATWSNYMAVYHMKENPAGGAPQLNDSTGNGNNATMQGAAVAGQQQPGEIDGSIGFTTSTWANLSSTSAFSFERTDSFSLSGWIKIGSNTNGQILTKQTAAENGGWMLFQNPVGASPAIELGLVGTNASTLALARTPSISIGTWHYVVATYSGTSTTAGMSIYVDGVPQTLTSISNNLSASILNNVAPAINSRATGYLESGDGMDELRVSTKGVVLTPAWVTASYNNESSPATFFTVSTGLTNP